MEHTPNTTLSPFRKSKSRFGVEYENGFVFSRDGRVLVGVNAEDATEILVEDLASGLAFAFGTHTETISTLFFEEDSGTLLAGDIDGDLVQYRLDLDKKKGWVTMDHGHLGIGNIFSCSGRKGFVFFGGNKKVRVFDLSSKEVLPGRVETALGWIPSLQVCAVERSRVYLAVVGLYTKSFSGESELYDFTKLYQKVSTLDELVGTEERLPTTKSPKAKTEYVQNISPSTNGSQTCRGSIKTLQERLDRLRAELTQKTLDHDALLIQNMDLQKRNRELERGIDSHQQTLAALEKANKELKRRVSRVESKLKQCEDPLSTTVNHKNSIKADLVRLRKTSDTKIRQLQFKLRLLNVKRKGHHTANIRSGTQANPDPAHVIRDFEYRLHVKTQELQDLKNLLRLKIQENTTYEAQIHATTKEVNKIRDQLVNTKSVNVKG